MTELRVLGAVDAVGPGGRAALNGNRQRAILGVLALHVGTVLPVPRLIDAVWGEDPPRTAVRTLHSHVARIRQALAGCGFPPVLVTKDAGYTLATTPAAVDVHRFEQQVSAARLDLSAGDPERARATLRSALGLWRGDAFADVSLAGWMVREVERLHELRLSATADLWDAELRLGNHDHAVRELPRLLAAHPTREPLVGLYMMALYRCGRHVEALTVFQELRERLAGELGVDPSPELIALHTSILRRDGGLEPASGAPAQLPASVGHFTGRAAQLDALDRVLADRPVVVITGAAGMGKTALAVHWAHRIADRFPDGNLFLDLRGHDPEHAMPAAEALAHLLRGLEVPDDRMPGEVAERAALYRSLLRGRRCLVLADNAGALADLLPLVPGAGGSLLVVTSRHSLTALGAHHAMHAEVLDPLGHEDSVALLSRVLGAGRVRREHGPAARLARLCGGMPLALRIAAARLATDPAGSIAEAAANLVSGNRLDHLAVDGDTRTVRAVLASTYLPLGATQTRMFNRLGLVPGATFSTWLCSALCGLPVATGHTAVAELADTHLVTPAGPDRFRFHDLIRDFARQCGRTDEPRAGQVEAGERLVDWYLFVAAAANEVIDPSRDRVRPTLRHAPPEVPFARDRQAAVAFLAEERDNLLPVVRYARENGWPAAAWQLTYLLTSFYDTTGHWHERVELCRHGTIAATALGDPLAKAEMLRALGVAYFMTRRLGDAVDTNVKALRAVQEAGDLAGEGHVYNNLANAHAQLRRFDEALAAHKLAVERCASAGNALGLALSQRNLGYTYVQMGRAEQSFEPLAAALAAFRELGVDRLTAGTLYSLGEAYLQLGRHDVALAHFDDAVVASRACGDRIIEWESLLHAGRVHLATGDPDAAVRQFEQALDIAGVAGDRHGEACALDRLGRAHLRAGDLDAARACLERGMRLRTRVPDTYEEAHLHRDLGDLEAACDRPADAAHRWGRAVELYRRANASAEAEELARAGGGMR